MTSNVDDTSREAPTSRTDDSNKTDESSKTQRDPDKVKDFQQNTSSVKDPLKKASEVKQKSEEIFQKEVNKLKNQTTKSTNVKTQVKKGEVKPQDLLKGQTKKELSAKGAKKEATPKETTLKKQGKVAGQSKTIGTPAPPKTKQQDDAKQFVPFSSTQMQKKGEQEKSVIDKGRQTTQNRDEETEKSATIAVGTETGSKLLAEQAAKEGAPPPSTKVDSKTSTSQAQTIEQIEKQQETESIIKAHLLKLNITKTSKTLSANYEVDTPIGKVSISHEESGPPTERNLSINISSKNPEATEILKQATQNTKSLETTIADKYKQNGVSLNNIEITA